MTYFVVILITSTHTSQAHTHFFLLFPSTSEFRDVILFPTPAFKRMLLVGVGTAIAQQAVGIEAIQYFLVFILDESGIKSRKSQMGILIALGLIKVIFIVLAGHLFDRRGRRPLFFLSLIGMSIGLLLVSMAFVGNANGAGFAVFGLALYLAFFSLGKRIRE
jgi:MFS family permease